VIESFRNQLWPGYKTTAGIEPELLAQFPLLEDVLSAAGIVVWPMVEFEADDALAAAAARWMDETEQVVICSPDKDLCQCVRGTKVVTWDRRRLKIYDDAGVIEKFGVPPRLIPDLLALIGDSADGIPGIRGCGPKSAAALLNAYGSLEAIPADGLQWTCAVRGAVRLGATLAAERELALLYKRLATLRTDVPLAEQLADLRWRGIDADRWKALIARTGFGRVLPPRDPAQTSD
jgi:5'-3' exonuclease